MDVLGHQARAKYVEAVAIAVLAEGFEVRTAVVINQNDIPTVVAALNNVVRLTRNDDPGQRCIPTTYPRPAGKSMNR